MALAEERLGTGRHILLIGVLTLGFFAGQAPLAIMLEELWLLIPMAVLAAVGAIWMTAGIRTPRYEHVAAEEWLIACGNAGFWGSFSMVGGIATYSLVYLVIWLLDKLPFLDISPATISFWAAVSIWAVSALSLLGELRTITEELLAADSSEPGPFAEMSKYGRARWWIGAALVLAVPTTAAIITGPFSLWTKILAGLSVVVGSALTLPEEESEYQPGTAGDYATAVRDVGRALEEAGYTVVRGPKTGESKIDSQLSDVDLYAYRSNFDAVLIDVRLKASSVEWTEAPDLMAAAVALRSWIAPEDGPANVRPVFVLIDSTPDPELLNFGSEFNLGILTVDRRAESVLMVGGPEELAAVGHKYLKLPDEAPLEAVP